MILEECLTGEELSFLVLSDGKHAAPLVPAQDHKRLGEGDAGPNTGGMGVYSTDQMLDDTMRDWLLHHVAQPTIDGMAAEDSEFTGVLYCGLMMTANGPMVLEYNARFGDPETQAILARLDSDLFEALEACVEGRLSETELSGRRARRRAWWRLQEGIRRAIRMDTRLRDWRRRRRCRGWWCSMRGRLWWTEDFDQRRARAGGYGYGGYA